MTNTCTSLMKLHMLCYVCLVIIFAAKSDAVNSITASEIKREVEVNKYVLVLFMNGNSETNRAAEEVLSKIETPDLYDQEVIRVTCRDRNLAASLGVISFPQLMFYRSQVPAMYDGELAAPAVQSWLEQVREVNLQTLDDTSFEHLTQASTGATTGDWLVMFYKDSCPEYLPALEGAGVLIRQKTNVAKVNVEESPETAERFHIHDCPTTYLFHHGKMYSYISQTSSEIYRVKSLVSFATSWYKNVEGARVPAIPTAFDKLTESIADYLKKNLQSPEGGNFLLIGGAVLAVIAFIVAVVVATCSRNAKKTVKED
eukprot:XP_011419876.1 PREDICTED: thioredoxin domain-containing protein-like [Crassostrea gigas]